MLRLTTLLFVLLTALPARAEPVSPASSEPDPPDGAYLDYRPLLLLSDASAVTALIAGAAMDNDASGELAWTGLAVYALAPPVIHLAHRQPTRAAASAGMRLGFPALGIGLGVGLASCEPRIDEAGQSEHSFGCPLGAALLGAMSGALAAILVDDLLLGEVEREDATSVHLAPLVSPRNKAFGLTVAGAF
jgi:hypothetical protein